MYGNGGGMGASTSGGQGSGVSNPGTTAVQQGIQAKMMGVQLGNVQSQTALNAAQAAKSMAEADKIKGVDTKATEATIENVIAQTDNEKAKNGLIYAQKRMAEIQGDLNNANIEEIGYNIRQIAKTIDLMDENITAAKISNEVAQATKKNQIEMSAINVLNGVKDALLKESQGKLTEAEAKAVTVKLAQGWKELELGESGQALQKLLGEWNNEREYTIGREKIDQQRMSSAVGVMTKELMGLQNQYNTEMAEGNQKRAMEMWDYTNYENQVKHMKNAGLSVGLMYGNGGGMGASTSGGQGSGVSNPGTTAVQQGLLS